MMIAPSIRITTVKLNPARTDQCVSPRATNACAIRIASICARVGRGCHARAGICLLGLVWLAAGRCAEVPHESVAAPVVGTGIFPASTSAIYGDDEFLIPEVFESHLPTTLEKYAFRLWLNPHLGDWQNQNYMRLTTGVRYGLTENWEVSAASDLYFSHGNGEVRAFERYGAANLQLGTKLNLGQPLFSGWDIGTGFDLEFPVSHPPAELMDGLGHFMPYMTFSHRLEQHKDLRIFWGVRIDEVTRTAIPGEFGKNAFHESSAGITGGWVIDRKNWHYTFETSYDTTRLIGRLAKDVFTARPGVIWEIPSRRNHLAKGHWMVGVAVKSTFGPGGTSLGGSLKLRYTRDLKIPLRHKPTTPTP